MTSSRPDWKPQLHLFVSREDAKGFRLAKVEWNLTSEEMFAKLMQVFEQWEKKQAEKKR